MKRSITLSLILCIVIVGCSSKNQRWYLHGKTEEQFHYDCYVCRYQTSPDSDVYNQSGEMIGYGAASGSAALAGIGALSALLQSAIAEDHYESCLEQKGYSKFK